MEVNKVNNQNSNVGLYTGIGTVAGGGVGALAGWNTKPFLKDDGPSDTFIKNVIARGEEIVSTDNPMYEQIKQFSEMGNSAKSVEELRAMVLKPVREMYEVLGDDIEAMKHALTYTAELSEGMGVPAFSAEDIASVKSLDDVVELFGKNFDKQFGGKTLEEIRQSSAENAQRIVKESVKTMFHNLWDTESKKFIKIDNDIDLDDSLKSVAENVRNLLDDVAKGMKGKAALIYGLSTAAIAGLGTFVGVKLLHKPDNKLAEQDKANNIQG